MPGTVASEGPTVSLSFANNFWGKDDAGVGPLLDRMHNAKTTGDELKAFYTARAQIEEEYAKKLLNLARKPLGTGEAGTLRMSLDVVRGEMESMGKEHQNVAAKMKSELDEPLAAFAGGMKERRKIVQAGIEKLLKVKNGQTVNVNKARDRFEQDCLKIKGYLAQGHMVMGQEERKNKAKLEKTQIQMSANSNEYEVAVKVLEETTGKWNREWKAACDKFQDLEEERIDYFKSSLWSFANIASTVCVSDDAACEKMRLSLEDCEVEKDITNFIKDSGTGQEIPDPPKYINFCRGDIDDAMSRADTDDGEYSVAQFQRTMNPAFRSSSPQPSNYEAHHDPDSSLREDMGLPKGRTSLQGDESFNARSSHGSAAPRPLAPTQAVAPPDPYANAPQIAHNPFPADGMTQFCRMGAPSERSSNPSPTRPESRDSLENSDYSAPTSLSSFEPTSGQHSPTKQYNGSGLSGMSSGAEDAQAQKKKGSFFQSHSPFRRRSNKSEDPIQPGMAAPTQRNTWTPATTRETVSAGTSPTKPPFGAANRASTWQRKQPSPSPDPDPVGPQTDYQLGIGNNVFDVESPDKRMKSSPTKSRQPDLDPIAQALAELKGVTKQASVRQSADRHYGMAPSAPSTPAFDARGMPAGAVPTPFATRSNGATPPPAYDAPPISRLGAPQPAHTSKEMQRTTERFVNQKRDMYDTGVASRPGSRVGRGMEPPRAASPQPQRAPSPQPYHTTDPRQQQQQQYRAPSPNPYGGQAAPRPRAQSSSPIKQQPNYSGYQSRGGSPGYQPPPQALRAASPNPGYARQPAPSHPRAASPNPAYARPPQGSMNGGSSRPPSSRGSDNGGGGGAMVLAPAGQDPYGSQQGGGRPQSQYYAETGGYGSQQVASRNRSQSAGTQRQVTKDGKPILHYARAMYMYQAAIPEELTFGKGDILAVTRHQDDGWWEAEVAGKSGHTGLVPSNYLKQC
ncbi:formin-binding protein [Friedmanniomyces endolithicus]|uniref:Formin-binding protein n=1 Tax=Friedmanniomyces endolithicus TaxID=329885 RepID=A0A4U0V7I8_9PEZI|nr:formin-binding protein [Friedmanniomyces endolithicus]KAK0363511.1 formin-binding protein [Friedmanniomyces endolithicus]KAK0778743.1 formin-binding protein [Friedmanniomyces endolithicus]KAK0784332.1 formin-binding protein [Friedmanniomyces endolithicus]KAK0784510.1 formin-binding protein [Friedmanniomyces endolithicus]